MSKKLTIEYIREQFEKEKYVLLTIEYINNKQKLEYICSKGHKHSICWAMWQRGERCPCQSNLMKPTIEFIRSEFAKERYKLLTKKYINAHQKLEYICDKGHKHSIIWNSWQRGHRCPYSAGVAKPTIEFIRSEFAKKDYRLLTEKYINNTQKLNYICPKGHKHNITWHSWQGGAKCPTCHRENNYGSNHPMWKGGISFEPYTPEFNGKLKKSILERDNHQCQNPDCWGTGSKLTGHHIDYDKKNCDPFNIITVCNSCNSRANKDREYWTKFYRNIMNEKHGCVYGK